MDLKATLTLGATSAKAELEAARRALANTSQKGGALEGFTKGLLRRHLPERIGITEGAIVSSDGFQSRQMDLILYDASDAPMFFNNGFTRIVPIEYVYAVVEVKARLDRQALKSTFEAQLAIKRARKYFRKGGSSLPVDYHGYGRRWLTPVTFSFLFAFEADMSGMAIFEDYKHSHLANPVNECIDSIYVNSEGLFTRGSTGLGLDCGVGDCSTIQWVKEDPMFYWIGLISMLSTDWRIRETPEFYRYLRTAPPAGRHEKIQPLVPIHPDLKP